MLSSVLHLVIVSICCLHVSLWSKVTPRKFAVLFKLILLLLMSSWMFILSLLEKRKAIVLEVDILKTHLPHQHII